MALFIRRLTTLKQDEYKSDRSESHLAGQIRLMKPNKKHFPHISRVNQQKTLLNNFPTSGARRIRFSYSLPFIVQVGNSFVFNSYFFNLTFLFPLHRCRISLLFLLILFCNLFPFCCVFIFRFFSVFLTLPHDFNVSKIIFAFCSLNLNSIFFS